MKKTLFITLAALLLMTLVCGISYAKSDTPFHPPQTEAEKVLDKIFHTYDKDTDLGGYIFGYPWYKHKKDKKFSHLVSKKFVESSTKEEKALITESCGGKYPDNGLPCEMIRDINPIYCSQDRPDTFFYRTIKSDNKTAIVKYTWPDLKDYGPAYKMTHEKDGWKLDNVYCDCGSLKKISVDLPDACK